MAVSLELLEQKAREIGQAVGSRMPAGAGFALLLFDFADRPGGFLTYISNAQRVDLVKVLRETADKLEQGLPVFKGKDVGHA